MNVKAKMIVLDQIYKIYDDFSKELNVACKKNCDACCTRNVTITTLEGYKIIDNLLSSGKASIIDQIQKEAFKKRFQPKTTTNGLAELTLQGEEPPTEESDFTWGPCPILLENNCPVYAVRPFGCRCFVSDRNCKDNGYASVDPFVITVNHIFMQYIEHIDINGYTANLTDIVLYLSTEDGRKHYSQDAMETSTGFIANRKIEILLVPPEHRQKIRPVLQSIQEIRIPGNLSC